MNIAIACASGGYRVTFVQGVLSVFESAGIQANAYGGTSASVIPAAFAALGKVNEMGIEGTRWALQLKPTSPNGMSGVSLAMLDRWGTELCNQLFAPDMPRFCIPVSAVISPEAAEETQGKGARALGRRLLLAAARGDRSWADKNLAARLYDTHGEPRLTADNFREVAYASSRMLHAWDVPAWIEGQPFVDASYTCLCPALELAESGFDEVIAISTTPGKLYRDFFGTQLVPDSWQGAKIHVIAPALDLKDIGADFTDATEDGLLNAYEHGKEQGRAFLEQRRF